MNYPSSRRPIFLTQSQRRIQFIKQAAYAVAMSSIITLSAFAAGYFFGG